MNELLPERDQDPASLLTLARAGRDDALGQLLELYRGYLSLLARIRMDRRLQAKIDAADLVQETFLQAYRDFGGFRGSTERELLAWLRTIMASKGAKLARSYFGTQRRNALLEEQLCVHLDQSSRALERLPPAGDSSPSHRAMWREQAVVLANALQKLPDHYREVIILHHLESFSIAEVAQEMGRSVDSVRKLWARSLIRMRRLVGDLT